MLWHWFGCAEPPPAREVEPVQYPLDEVLTFADLQTKGTHNSYHLITNTIPELQYEHAPLGVQLAEQGVRQFELDVSFGPSGEHLVFHLPLVDQGTTCVTFADCASDLLAWSDLHRDHHPLFVLVETKDPWDDEYGPSRLDSLEDELRSVWPPERLVTPADVQRDHADLASALASDGWPTLGELRGRALFVLHDGGERRAAFVAGGLAERALFPDAMGDVSVPWAAVHTMNDPTDPRIPEVVRLHHLVRTRADADMVEVTANDPTNRDAAFTSGAHFVSTDVPVPLPGTPYVVEMPGGTPSRCNPVHAPAECTSYDIEHLTPGSPP